MKKFIKKITEFFKQIKTNRDKEYSKRLLNFIIRHSILMMWCSYILAWFEKVDIAETLSKTIATVIIGVVIPHLITKTVENVNKYGSRLNKTTAEFEEELIQKESKDDSHNT